MLSVPSFWKEAKNGAFGMLFLGHEICAPASLYTNSLSYPPKNF